MKILIVVANFIPELGSAAHIYYDLATAFVKKGHDVHVITSYPRKFYLDKKDAETTFPQEEIIDGINVHRHKSLLYSRDNVILRGIEHYWLPVAYYNVYKKLGIKFDVCLIYIPPLPLYYFARWIKTRDKTPSVLNFQDFHPQELVDVDVLKNKFVVKIMEHIEKQAYSKADYITVMSNAGIDFIKQRASDQQKVACIYNSVNPSDFDPYPKVDFKVRENVKDKLVITYAGILSPFQGLDDILDAAKYVRDHKDIIFYIIGDGMSKSALENRVKIENISNVRILPLQPREEYFNIIASSDINIVTLDKRMMAPALPGKFINLLGVKKPIIANVPSNNDIAYIITKHKCGILIEPGKPEQIANAVLKIKDDPETGCMYGQRGYSFLEDRMNLINNSVKYEQIFENIISH